MVVWESGVVVGEALHMHHTYAPIKAVGYDHRDNTVTGPRTLTAARSAARQNFAIYCQ